MKALAILAALVLAGCSKEAGDYIAGQAGLVELAVRDALPPPKQKPQPPMCLVRKGQSYAYEVCQ